MQYRIRMETLKTQILNLSVWHNDTFGRNSFLGEVELDLSEWDFGSTQVNNFILRRRVRHLERRYNLNKFEFIAFPDLTLLEIASMIYLNYLFQKCQNLK